MGVRKVEIKQSVAESIAETAWYLESKGLLKTAEKFSDSVYDFFIKLSDVRRTHSVCRDPKRALLGYKCISYKKKYTVVFLESNDELVICEFILSSSIHW